MYPYDLFSRGSEFEKIVKAVSWIFEGKVCARKLSRRVQSKKFTPVQEIQELVYNTWQKEKWKKRKDTKLYTCPFESLWRTNQTTKKWTNKEGPNEPNKEQTNQSTTETTNQRTNGWVDELTNQQTNPWTKRSTEVRVNKPGKNTSAIFPELCKTALNNCLKRVRRVIRDPSCYNLKWEKKDRYFWHNWS